MPSMSPYERTKGLCVLLTWLIVSAVTVKARPLELQDCLIDPQREEMKVVDVLTLETGDVLVAYRFEEQGREFWAVENLNCEGKVTASIVYDRRVNALNLSPVKDRYYVLGGPVPTSGDTTGFVSTIEILASTATEICREHTPAEIHDACLVDLDGQSWLMTTGVAPTSFGSDSVVSSFVYGFDVSDNICPQWPAKKWVPLDLNGGRLTGSSIDFVPSRQSIVVSGLFVGKPLVEGGAWGDAGDMDGFLMSFTMKDGEPGLVQNWGRSLKFERPETLTRHVTQTGGGTIWVISSSGVESLLVAYDVLDGKSFGKKSIGSLVVGGSRLHALDIALLEDHVVVLVAFDGEWKFPLGYGLLGEGAAVLRYDVKARLQSVQALSIPRKFYECGSLDSLSERLTIGIGEDIYDGKNDPDYVRTLVAFDPGAPMIEEDIYKELIACGGCPYIAVPQGNTRAVGGAWFRSADVIGLQFKPLIEFAGEDIEFERTSSSSSTPGSDWYREAIGATAGTLTSASTQNPAVLFVIDGDPALSSSFVTSQYHQVQGTDDESGDPLDTALPTKSSSAANAADHASQVTALAASNSAGIANGIQLGINPVNVFSAVPPSSSTPQYAYASAVYAGLCRADSKWFGIASGDSVGVDKSAAGLPVVFMPLSTVNRIQFDNKQVDSLDASLVSIRDALECLASFAVVVVTAGNNNAPVVNSDGGYYPAAFRTDSKSPGLHENIMVVGGTRYPVNQPYTQTNHGPEVDIWAPGQDICVGGVSNDGTSLAGALVAGALARLLADMPEKTSGVPVRNPSAIRSWLLTDGCGSRRMIWATPPSPTEPSFLFLNASGSRIGFWKSVWGIADGQLRLDTDNDTTPTGMEYLKGTNPKAADFAPWSFELVSEGINHTLSFDAASYVTPGDLTLQCSAELFVWFPVPTGQWSEIGIGDGMKRMRYAFVRALPLNHQFYRVIVNEK